MTVIGSRWWVFHKFRKNQLMGMCSNQLLLTAPRSPDIMAKSHLIVADSLSDLSDEVHLNLPNQRSLKRTIQRTRVKDAVSANPDITSACDSSLLLLYIPPSLLDQWKVFDSGPSNSRIIILTTDKKP